MTIRKVTINNRYGIHVRPSAIIIKQMALFPGVSFSLDKGEGPSIIDNIMDLITMGIEDKANVTVSATGQNEGQACEQIAATLASNFDFER